MTDLDSHMGWESKYGGQSVIPSLLYEMGSLISLELSVCSIRISWLDSKPQEFTFLSEIASVNHHAWHFYVGSDYVSSSSLDPSDLMLSTDLKIGLSLQSSTGSDNLHCCFNIKHSSWHLAQWGSLRWTWNCGTANNKQFCEDFWWFLYPIGISEHSFKILQVQVVMDKT